MRAPPLRKTQSENQELDRSMYAERCVVPLSARPLCAPSRQDPTSPPVHPPPPPPYLDHGHRMAIHRISKSSRVVHERNGKGPALPPHPQTNQPETATSPGRPLLCFSPCYFSSLLLRLPRSPFVKPMAARFRERAKKREANRNPPPPDTHPPSRLSESPALNRLPVCPI